MRFFPIALFYLSLTPQICKATEPLELQYQARQIIAHKCWKCHGSERDEGNLRLHTRMHIIESGVVNLKSPKKSELIKRIQLPEGHEDFMPQDAKPLKKSEIETLTKWIDSGLKWEGRGAFKEAPLLPRRIQDPHHSEYTHKTDQLIDAYFNKNRITWPENISDRIFLKRAYLDCVGLLPTIEQTQTFINDKSPKKRSELIQSLLLNHSAYSSHWLTFWNDLLRNDYSGTGFITGGRKQITKWLISSLKTNKKYDQMVLELFSTKKESKGFIGGIKWRGTVSASQTIEMQAAQNSAQVFMGINIKCASCHDAFTSNWSLQQSHSFAAIFHPEGSIDIHRCDKPTGLKATPAFLFNQLGNIEPKAPLETRLQQLGKIITNQKNGRFSRTIVNRFWNILIGRGFIYRVDEMDTQAWSDDVLDDLAFRFAKNNYDLKWLISEIMTSKAYQLPSVVQNSQHQISSNKYIFRGPIVRRVTAEQFVDTFSQVVIPLYAKNKKGEVPRASSLKRDVFQTALGRPNRENVTSTREARGNLLESLELTNGTLLNEAIIQASEKAYKDFADKPELFIQELFQKGMLRPPSARELRLLSSMFNENKGASAYHDIIWIFINLPEFQSIL